MSDTSDLRIDCQTCLAANTTACGECIVTHLLANDDGPIPLRSTDLVTQLTIVRAPDPVDAAVDLLSKAGLLDDPPTWVVRDVFDSGRPLERRVSVVG